MIVGECGVSGEGVVAEMRGGEVPAECEGSVLGPFVDSVVEEIGRALQFFFTSTPHNKVDHIMLAGGSSALPGLTAAVTKHTSFSCSLVNPFDGMEIGSGVRLKKMTREAPSYLTSCGLALRRFTQ